MVSAHSPQSDPLLSPCRSSPLFLSLRGRSTLFTVGLVAFGALALYALSHRFPALRSLFAFRFQKGKDDTKSIDRTIYPLLCPGTPHPNFKKPNSYMAPTFCHVYAMVGCLTKLFMPNTDVKALENRIIHAHRDNTTDLVSLLQNTINSNLSTAHSLSYVEDLLSVENASLHSLRILIVSDLTSIVVSDDPSTPLAKADPYLYYISECCKYYSRSSDGINDSGLQLTLYDPTSGEQNIQLQVSSTNNTCQVIDGTLFEEHNLMQLRHASQLKAISISSSLPSRKEDDVEQKKVEQDDVEQDDVEQKELDFVHEESDFEDSDPD